MGGDDVEAILVLFAIVDGLILLDMLGLLLRSDPRRSVGDHARWVGRGKGRTWLDRLE
jgi:hypothetical protein